MATAVNALVLAAGKGTRMKSSKAKVLHEVFFAPMVHHVLEALLPLSPVDDIYVVTGHQHEAVASVLAPYGITLVHQQEQKGTGHAVLAAESVFCGKKGTILILCGDTPLIRPNTLQRMVEAHTASGGLLTVMTTQLDDPTHYGRILTDTKGSVVAIVEEKDASPEERRIGEINAGIYCVEVDFLFQALRQVGTDNKQGEMYLTDIVAIANREGYQVNRFLCEDAAEVLGVNSRLELAQAHEALQRRRNLQLMADGVTMLHPETVAIASAVTIGRDTVIQPGVTITGQSVIGEGCSIGPFVTIHDCRIGQGATVGSFCCLEGMTIAPGQKIPPHTVALPHT